MTESESQLRSLLTACQARPDRDAPAPGVGDLREEHRDAAGRAWAGVRSGRARLAPHDPRQAALLRREAELLRAHQANWLGPLAPISTRAVFSRGLLALELTGESLAGARCLGGPEAAWVEG